MVNLSIDRWIGGWLIAVAYEIRIVQLFWPLLRSWSWMRSTAIGTGRGGMVTQTLVAGSLARYLCAEAVCLLEPKSSTEWLTLSRVSYLFGW